MRRCDVLTEAVPMKFVGRGLAALALALLLMSGGGVVAAAYPLAGSDASIQDGLDYLRGQQAPDGSVGGFGDSAFACIAIAAAGEDPNTWSNGGASLVDYLKDGPSDVSGEFNMGTFLARMVLAAVASGESPASFGSWSGSHLGVTVTDGDYLAALKSLHDGTQFLQDLTGDPDSAETLNDDFWAVRALIAAGESPYSQMVQSAVQFIMSHQEADGGWTWGTSSHTWYMPGSTDVDSTAAALVALCLAREHGTAVADGLSFMRSNQDSSGGFNSIWMGVNVQSTAWVVDAIAASGQDPTDGAWTPVADDPIDYLLAAQLGDGSFDGTIRATSDALAALAGAHYRGVAQAAPRTVGGEAFAADVAGSAALLLLLCGLIALALFACRPGMARLMRNRSCSRVP